MWRADAPMDELRAGHTALMAARRPVPASLEIALRHPVWNRLVRLQGAMQRRLPGPQRAPRQPDLFATRGPLAANGVHPMPLPADFQPPPATPGTLADTLTPQAYRLADDYAISDIEAFGEQVVLDDAIWWDTTPMLDEREWCPTSRDMARVSIDYAVKRGLFLQHPRRPELLRRMVTR